MNKINRFFLATGVSIVSIAISNPVDAVTVRLGSGNVGIDSINVSVVGSTITIEENWTSNAPGFLEFSDLDGGVNYTIQKIITNNTGDTWTSFANELLDPSGDSNDSSDPTSQPSFVPVGFSTSNDFDGLSFAQGSGLPRTSSVFPSITVDELTDERDFIDFFGASLPNGGTDNFMTFGLRDSDPLNNQPFLLSQRPNVFSTPIPSTPESSTILGLLALSAFGLSSVLKRKLN
jgi:hypothetical protein